MPGGSRSLPGHPSLRHLKLEAKRRLAAGEFPTLHDAQVAIAREYGLPTWAGLKQRVSDTSGVNVDQEMANLLGLQNAYAANAHVLSAVKAMVDSLMQIL